MQAHAAAQQRRQRLQQTIQTTAMIIDRHGPVRPRAENLPGEPGQHIAWADLQKQPRASGMHRFDLAGEIHRFGEMRGQPGANCCRLRWIGIGIGIAMDGEGRGAKRQFGHECRQPRPCRLDDRRMERGRHRQRHGGNPVRRQRLPGLFDGGGRSRQHQLLRRVVIGQGDAGHARQRRLHRLHISPRRQHGAQFATGGSLDDETAARFRQAQQRIQIEYPSGMQRHIFAIAVPRRPRRLHIQGPQPGP